MQNKLQELTKKIYNEGVAKGNEEADKIIAKANQDAQSIIQDAEKKAESIIKEAEKKAKELNDNTQSELKLATRQVINTIKQNIVNIISGEIVTKSTKEALSDKIFIKGIIEKIVANWNSGNTSSDLKILLPEKDQKELDEFFKKEATDLLKKGVTLNFEKGIVNGFQITPQDGSYKVSFTESEFEAFFKEYLRPKLVELLFGE